MQFKRLDEDREKVRYGNDASGYMIYKHKDGSGFELLHFDKDDKRWHKIDEAFTTLEGAVQFASEKFAVDRW